MSVRTYEKEEKQAYVGKRSIKRHIETSNLILYNWTRV